MKCNLDHTLEQGKFCKSCGTKLSKGPRLCRSGHEINASARFCSICGERAVEVPADNQASIKPSISVVVAPSYSAAPIPPMRAKTNGLAIASFVLSITCFCAPLGIVFGGVALSQLKKDSSQTGQGLAIAGIILGVIGSIYIVFNFFLGWFIGY